MLTDDELKAKLLADPEVKAEYDRIEREQIPLLDAILSARKKAGLVSGKHSPSMATLRQYANALGKQLQV